MLLEIMVNNHKWHVEHNPGNLQGAWVTAEELGKHLGYEDHRSINKIYKRHREGFINKVDTFVVKLAPNPINSNVGGNPNTRVFSERGVLKVIRYSDTEVADRIMDEVFDVFLAVKKQQKKEYTKQKMLELFIREMPANWTKAFPDHFMEAVAHLYNIEDYTPGTTCLAIANFIKNYIYKCAPDGIYEELQEKNPGCCMNREFKHHQFLTVEAKSWLKDHIVATLTTIKNCNYDREVFHNVHRRTFPQIQSMNDMIQNGQLKLQLSFTW